MAIKNHMWEEWDFQPGTAVKPQSGPPADGAWFVTMKQEQKLPGTPVLLRMEADGGTASDTGREEGTRPGCTALLVWHQGASSEFQKGPSNSCVILAQCMHCENIAREKLPTTDFSSFPVFPSISSLLMVQIFTLVQQCSIER